MRAGGVAGRAGLADPLAGGDPVPLVDGDGCEVGVLRVVAARVLDDDRDAEGAPQDTRTTRPAPAALTGVPMGTAKSWPVWRFAQREPPLPKPADRSIVSTGATHGAVTRVGGWSRRTAPRQLPAATEASACPCNWPRASSSRRWMPCFRSASSAFRFSSVRHADADFASSDASRTSALWLRPIAFPTARSAWEKTC